MPLDSEVVITGIGVISPIGLGEAAFWARLSAGESGIIPLADVRDGEVDRAFGGIVCDFDGRNYVQPRKALKVMSRELQMGYSAAMMALEAAKVERGQLAPESIGTVFGSEMFYGPPEEAADTVKAVNAVADIRTIDDGELIKLWGAAVQHNLFPLWMLKYLPNMPACHVGIAIDAQGPNNTLVLDDTSALAAVIEAAMVIQRGHAELMVAGGTGTRVNPTRLVCPGAVPYAKSRSCVAESSRPFAADRDGFVGGEGAGAIVLETAAHARKRGAPVLARLTGWSNRFIAPKRRVRGSSEAVSAAVRDAIKMAALDAHHVSHVDAHAMGDIEMDAAEAAGLQAVLPNTPVTASKSLYGHLGAACGAVELVGSILSLKHRLIPPTRNAEKTGSDCPVRVITKPAPTNGRGVVKISHTAQGHATALVIESP